LRYGRCVLRDPYGLDHLCTQVFEKRDQEQGGAGDFCSFLDKSFPSQIFLVVNVLDLVVLCSKHHKPARQGGEGKVHRRPMHAQYVYRQQQKTDHRSKDQRRDATHSCSCDVSSMDKPIITTAVLDQSTR
jgi:hypothetical protein